VGFEKNGRGAPPEAPGPHETKSAKKKKKGKRLRPYWPKRFGHPGQSTKHLCTKVVGGKGIFLNLQKGMEVQPFGGVVAQK